MYDYIIGQVKRVTHEYIVLEQQHIGWCIYTPNPFVFQVKDELQQVYIHMHVREDAHQLFGFKSLDQRELFRKLIQVSGIGPKGALAILAGGNPAHVISAIESEDEALLVKFPGVGKKTARQMILDLKGKLGNLAIQHEIVIPSKEDELPLFGVNPNQHLLEEAFLALSALGYSDKELLKIKPDLEQNENLSTTEGYMKVALQLLLTSK
ncbi:Holliday junction ATP-dependent DNA helicase RuvA [Lysinibacillus sp. PLM2]|nr:Holliday junction ATP-dependent DNA helicase RuvA [Lysinibacillus sp. PLM2]